MSFLTTGFALFLAAVFAAYWCVPPKYRWLAILLSSVVYYLSWGASYIVFLLFGTLTSYFVAHILEKSRNKKAWLLSGIFLCGISLIIFKYLGWMLVSVQAFLDWLGIGGNRVTLSLLAPVGISFYTFQIVGYLIDVYKGKTAAEHHFGIYAAYVSFFPQIVSGPISRANDLIPQIKNGHPFQYDQGTHGLKLIAVGIFKKMVIADYLSAFVNQVFDNIYAYSGFALVIAALLFSIEIYCDFSGYSDLAIGMAQLFGIDLKQNFRSPYFSTSVKEFWSRWHISLSTWFRDYVYIPLGGSRCSKIRNYRNLMITFLVSGIWHGANWTYILWGGLHGAAQCVEKALPRRKNSSAMYQFFSGVMVFLFVTATWVFFRANTVSEAVYCFAHAFSGMGSITTYVIDGIMAMSESYRKLDLMAIAAAMLVMFVYDFYARDTDVLDVIRHWKKPLRWSVYLLFTTLMIFLLPAQGDNSFIYFQF